METRVEAMQVELEVGAELGRRDRHRKEKVVPAWWLAAPMESAAPGSAAVRLLLNLKKEMHQWKRVLLNRLRRIWSRRIRIARSAGGTRKLGDREPSPQQMGTTAP